MMWDPRKARQRASLFNICWFLLLTTASSSDNRGSNGFGHVKNGLQDENFHELNRWQPPVRLMPFDPSKMARTPFMLPDPSSESEIGSGGSRGQSCDDEDGDCGESDELTDILSSAGFEAGMKTRTQESKRTSTTEFSSTITSFLVKDTNSTDPVAEEEVGVVGRATKAPSLRTKPIVATTKHDIPMGESYRTIGGKSESNMEQTEKTGKKNSTTVETPKFTTAATLRRSGTLISRRTTWTSNRNSEENGPGRWNIASIPTARVKGENEKYTTISRMKTSVVRTTNTMGNATTTRTTATTKEMVTRNISSLLPRGTIGSDAHSKPAVYRYTKSSWLENKVEHVAGNVCQGVHCNFGGVCVRHGTNRGMCLCPVGKGGKYCERAAHFTHPKFSGSSYMLFNNTRRSGKNFRVSIEFKADDLNGVILFVGDPENVSVDFFAVVLIDGFIQIRAECGAGFIAISSSSQIKMSSWHHITARKFDGKLYLQVDNDPIVSGGSKCLAKEMQVSNLYLGGLKTNLLQMRNIGLIPGFAGCVRKFALDRKDYILNSRDNSEIDGLDIADCAAGSCDLQQCMNGGKCIPVSTNSSRCSCPLGFTGKSCSKDLNVSMPRLHGSGFLQFNALESSAWSKIDIEMVIKPRSLHGLLLFNGDRQDGRGDYILVSLKNGFVELRFDCGTGEAVIRSRTKIVTNSWHHIKVSREGNIGKLLLDVDDLVIGKSKGSFQMLKLRQPLFIGGASSFSDIPWSADVHSGFNGCIEKVMINNRNVHWSSAVNGTDVRNCDSHDCFKKDCSNHGVCESYKGKSWCHCHLGYNGKSCEKNTTISIPRFNGHSFLTFEDRELFKGILLPTSNFSLEFKTNHSDGLILWNGQKNSNFQWKGDYMSLTLINGYMNCRFNLGGGEIVLNSTTELNDDRWHHVWISRNKQQSQMTIDKVLVATAYSSGNYTILNTDGELFLGDAEGMASTTGLRHLKGFKGCIKNLAFGDNHIDLMKNASNGHNIEQCISTIQS